VATIQIRDLPDETYETIRRRAARAGQSIQNYMREELIALAARRTRAEVLAAIEAGLAEHPPHPATGEDIAALVRAERR
jgi:antitoxin FitA